MTEAQTEKYIGRRGRLKVDGLRFPIIVTDAKSAYGNLRYRVTPDAGLAGHGGAMPATYGQQWVNAERVELDNA